MEQLPEFDIDCFEQRVGELLQAYTRLQAEHQALQAAHTEQSGHTAQLRERLNSVIERIRVLETEADSVQG